MEYKNIVFDVGNVLVDFCYMKYMESLGFTQELAELFRDKLIISEIWNDMDRGALLMSEAREIFKNILPEHTKEVDAFIDNIAGIVEEYDYSEPVVRKLKEQGYKVYILSNYPKDMADLHWKNFKFLKEADGYIISAYEKKVKPERAIYDLLTERFNVDLSESIFIDDRQINVDAANEYGMKGILFKDYDGLRKELLDLLGAEI
ncbi:MAG: HAD family phosphatase [Eubacterium sp.]|nr:HAD family phosphatase [Eubacterium sp.]